MRVHIKVCFDGMQKCMNNDRNETDKQNNCLKADKHSNEKCSKATHITPHNIYKIQGLKRSICNILSTSSSLTSKENKRAEANKRIFYFTPNPVGGCISNS